MGVAGRVRMLMLRNACIGRVRGLHLRRRIAARMRGGVVQFLGEFGNRRDQARRRHKEDGDERESGAYDGHSEIHRVAV